MTSLGSEIVRLRAGLQQIIDAGNRIEALEKCDQYREGYQAAWRDARNMATRSIWPVYKDRKASPELLSVMLDLFENPQFEINIGGDPLQVVALWDRAKAALAVAKEVQS